MESQLTPQQAFGRAVEIVGGQSAFGRLIGRKQSTVWDWLQKKALLPAEYVLSVEAATGVSRHDLRPDIYPLVLPGMAPSHVDAMSVGDKAPAVSCSRSPLLHAEPAR